MDSLPEINIMDLSRYIRGDHVILWFSADWCPYCAELKPIMPMLERKYSQWKFWLVDVDSHREIVKTLNVLGIPSLVAFEKGKEVGRLVNGKPKTWPELTDFLSKLPVSAVK